MNRKKQVLNIARGKGVINAKDVESAGISRNYLYMLHDDGLLIKSGRGIYMATDISITEHIDIIEVSKKIPNAVICLISSLNFHNITTQIPHKIWISLPRDSWKPKLEYPPLSIVLMSNETYHFGIEKHNLNGSEIKVYTPAKTVADCFKFRSKVGLDVAIEALKEVFNNKKATVRELFTAAEKCNVKNIMQPYIEALI